LSQFGDTRDEAIANYSRFVAAGMNEASPLARTCHQTLLGDEAFISVHQQSQRTETPRDTGTGRISNNQSLSTKKVRSAATREAQIPSPRRASPEPKIKFKINDLA